jgi:hypothetical protein
MCSKGLSGGKRLVSGWPSPSVAEAQVPTPRIGFREQIASEDGPTAFAQSLRRRSAIEISSDCQRDPLVPGSSPDR